MPAGIWNADEDKEWKINLPPRTRLFTSTEDAISDSWLELWGITNIFFLVLITMAIWKLSNVKMAALSFISIVLFTSISWTIWLLWLCILPLLIWVRWVKAYGEKDESNGRSYIKISFALLAVGVTVCLSAFSYNFLIKEVQYMINPSLEFKKNNVDISLLSKNGGSSSLQRNTNPIGESNDYDVSFNITEHSSISQSKIIQSAPVKLVEDLTAVPSIKRNEPLWSVNGFNLVKKINKDVKLYVVPVWLVNIMGAIQIFILAMLLCLTICLTSLIMNKNILPWFNDKILKG